MSRKSHLKEGKYNTYYTDPELISMLAKNRGISFEEAKNILEDVIDCIRTCIITNEYLNLKKLGLFKVHQRKTGKKYGKFDSEKTIPITNTLRFTTSKSMRNLLNDQIRKKMYNVGKEE